VNEVATFFVKKQVSNYNEKIREIMKNKKHLRHIKTLIMALLVLLKIMTR